VNGAVAATLARPRRIVVGRLAPRHMALGAILAGSAVLNINRLAQNGYANTYYSAAVKSMLGSLHNFFFVAYDPGGLVSVDKPPLALWVQTLSAKVLGLGPMSVLLPNAIAGVLAVAVLYRIVARRFGTVAGLLSAAALAGFPSLVAVARDNNPDAILVLLMVLACGAALTAVETGRLRSLVWCAVLIGLAFNTKMLAAYLVVPGIAVAYLVCAPGSVRRRLGHLAAAGLVMVVVSGVWIAAVDLTPASARPWVGSTRDNSELGLAFNYNGLGRVAGQLGGPGRTGRRFRGFPGSVGRRAARGAPAPAPGAGSLPPPAFGAAPPPGAPPLGAAPGASPPPGLRGGGPPGGPGGGRNGVFGGPTGPLRLFSDSLGGQGAWLIPFALLGGAGVALTARRRRDPRLAPLIVLGGWFLTEAVLLSFAGGIVHPYYVSAMGPGLAAMVGAGAVALAARARRSGRAVALAALAIGATVAVEIVLIGQEGYMGWFAPVLVAGGAAAIAVIAMRRHLARAAVIGAVGLLLVTPVAFASTTWSSPVSGTFPAAGKIRMPGPPGVGARGSRLMRAGGPFGQRASTGLEKFLRTHPSGKRFQLLTQSSMSASSLILDGFKVGSMGGFNGDDPALTAKGLARLVARGEARYVAVGGAFPGRRGNSATTAVQRYCTSVPSSEWQGSAAGGIGSGPFGQDALYDCAGKAAQLARAA
jgi:4-amino-4-deoxy-L-arabinose transferase-like glycosyltransferase